MALKQSRDRTLADGEVYHISWIWVCLVSFPQSLFRLGSTVPKAKKKKKKKKITKKPKGKENSGKKHLMALKLKKKNTENQPVPLYYANYIQDHCLVHVYAQVQTSSLHFLRNCHGLYGKKAKLQHRYCIILLQADKSYSTVRSTDAKYICMLVSLGSPRIGGIFKAKMGQGGKLPLTLFLFCLYTQVYKYSSESFSYFKKNYEHVGLV